MALPPSAHSKTSPCDPVSLAVNSAHYGENAHLSVCSVTSSHRIKGMCSRRHLTLSSPGPQESNPRGPRECVSHSLVSCLQGPLAFSMESTESENWVSLAPNRHMLHCSPSPVDTQTLQAHSVNNGKQSCSANSKSHLAPAPC